MHKKNMDIEKLLHWAYRDELPKTAVQARSPWEALLRMGEMGAMIDDQWMPPPGFPPLMGEAHPDAKIVADAVRQLKDESIEWEESRASLMGDLLALAPDKGTFMVASLRTQALVVMHASMGTRPDWTSDPPECHRVLGSNGKPVIEFDGPAKLVVVGRLKNRHYGPGSRCPLRWEPAPESIAIGRAEYAAWRKGLVYLTEALAGQMADYEPLPPNAAPEPWNTGVEPQSRVIPGKYLPGPTLSSGRPVASAPYRYRLRREAEPSTSQSDNLLT